MLAQLVSAWMVCRWCCRCCLTAVNAEPVLSQEWHYSKQITITVSLSYLIQHFLPLSHTYMMNSNACKHTHIPCSIDPLPEDTRSSHMVSIFKTGLSNGDLYYNLINMGGCFAQRLSWQGEMLLKE